MGTVQCIGITGGIGTGKSRVSSFWSRYANLPLINIDQVCQELLEIDRPGWHVLRKRLGKRYFKVNEQLDRPALRSAIFEDDSLRSEVNELIHPLALDLFHEKKKSFRGLVLVDVPLLFEAGWESLFSRIVVVYADEMTCCSRICYRDKVSKEDASRAVISQNDIWQKALLADHVIDNRYGWYVACLQVIHLARMVTLDFA